MNLFCPSLTQYTRRPTVEVRVGAVRLGGDNPIRLQSMTNTDTNDTGASAAQVVRIVRAGGEIVRLTTQGRREAQNLAEIKQALAGQGFGSVPLVADVHFNPAVALEAAATADKVRINPGNWGDDMDRFRELLARCRRRGVALRIGVNHGSLSPRMMERYGDTPEGMVASAMEFLRVCREEKFDQVVLSMKSSNVRVMVYAYRMLVAAMDAEGMRYPLHLGVTEAGDAGDGRIKSAVGIGTLLADGIGDTIRVSLTEAPEREIAVARKLASYFSLRNQHAPIDPVPDASVYSPYAYRRRPSVAVGRVGGDHVPLIASELTADEHAAIAEGRIVVLDTASRNGVADQRAQLLRMAAAGDTRPVILRRRYKETDLETLQVKAAADLGALLVDGFGDGIWIDNEGPVAQADIDALALGILQAARVRMSKTEYIACPGCGRTLYDLQSTLRKIRAYTGHLKGLKIGVMGCIVNGPGEMADADYGYVGAGPGRITLYRGREVVERNIPEAEALDRLVALIRRDGRWQER
ncbi:MAG: (E)-4-hydroxy-3-methylbut-2-enyl-diphosphate synthase [Rikenellaceae bacterium]|nr:(E)-4-hydroxy-3-methylbut-2-enyl-diphosphate synthase [Rikenellaceae bacterium]